MALCVHFPWLPWPFKYAGLFSSCGAGALWRHGVFSKCAALFADHGLWGTRALKLRLSGLVALEACVAFPNQGSNLFSCLAGAFFTPEPPGKPSSPFNLGQLPLFLCVSCESDFEKSKPVSCPVPPGLSCLTVPPLMRWGALPQVLCRGGRAFPHIAGRREW